MKVTLMTLILFLSTLSFAQTVNMLPGLYKIKTKVDMGTAANQQMKEAQKQMESLPKEMRAQALKQMEQVTKNMSKEQVTEECVLKEDLNQNEFLDSLNNDYDCEKKMIKQTDKEIQAEFKCENSSSFKVNLKLLNNKHYSYEGVGKFDGKNQSTIKSEGTWVSAKCSADSIKRRNERKD